jgi:hypothetical protein
LIGCRHSGQEWRNRGKRQQALLAAIAISCIIEAAPQSGDCDMKTFFTALALATVIAVQAFGQAANAAPNDRRDGAGQKSGCMYAGYPCSDWDHIQDGW